MVLTLFNSVISTPPVLAQASGSIEGVVVQGTADGGAVAGLEVLLLTFQGQEKIDERSGMLDREGRFRFEGLDPNPERIYFPLVLYKGVSYYSSPLTFADATAQSVRITIYESTDRDDSIAVPRANLILTGVDPERVYVMEMGAVANQGDRAYAAAETLRFPLPSGAEGFNPQFGILARSVTQSPGGFALSGPVLPGEHELAFSYEMAVQGDEVVLSRTLQYPVQQFSLFVPLDGVQVSSPQFVESGTRDLGGQTYRVLSAANLPRGTTLEIRVHSFPGLPGALTERLGYLLLAGGLLVVLGVLAYAWRRGAQAEPIAAVASADTALEARREELLASIAELDDRFEGGELSEADYRRAREVAKRRLVSLLRDRQAQEYGQPASSLLTASVDE